MDGLEDDSVFSDADAIVIYADGGGGHPAMPHLDKLKKANRPRGWLCLSSLRR